MKNSLHKSLEIDITYSINSFFYFLKNLPILKDLITDDIYANTILKRRLRLLSSLYLTIKKIIGKVLYIFFLFYLCQSAFPKNTIKSFIHIYFVFTIIGIFINNKLLNTSKKKYISLILFQMDDVTFLKSTFLWNQLSILVLNSFAFFLLYLLYDVSIYYLFLGVILSFFSRIVGEALNILYYQKYHYIWYSNTILYFTILGTLLLVAALPFLGYYLSNQIMWIIIIGLVIGSVPSIVYLWNIKNYKAMYKMINNQVKQMSSENSNDYLKQMMVEVKEKDKEISSSKIEGKTGFDLLNTIFFERHKEILFRSAKKCSAFLIIAYLVIIYFIKTDNKYYQQIQDVFQNRQTLFIFIMFFINRGSVVTQAMFFNCDHAMLQYNFYREPKNIISLFQKRLKTIIKINLLPALVIAIGNTILQAITLEFQLITIIMSSLFIIALSTFFSIHYLAIYYLLQPYDKDLEIKKVSYTITIFITYLICYRLLWISINPMILSIGGIIFSIVYMIISIRLVYKISPRTFKIRK